MKCLRMSSEYEQCLWMSELSNVSESWAECLRPSEWWENWWVSALLSSEYERIMSVCGRKLSNHDGSVSGMAIADEWWVIWSVKSRHEGAIRILPEELLGFKNLLSFASHKWRVNRWLAYNRCPCFTGSLFGSSLHGRLQADFQLASWQMTGSLWIQTGALKVCTSISCVLSQSYRGPPFTFR